MAIGDLHPRAPASSRGGPFCPPSAMVLPGITMPAQSKPAYDFPTAVTFFLAGLGAGAIVALIFSPQLSLHSAPARDAARQ